MNTFNQSEHVVNAQQKFNEVFNNFTHTFEIRDEYIFNNTHHRIINDAQTEVLY